MMEWKWCYFKKKKTFWKRFWRKPLFIAIPALEFDLLDHDEGVSACVHRRANLRNLECRRCCRLNPNDIGTASPSPERTFLGWKQAKRMINMVSILRALMQATSIVLRTIDNANEKNERKNHAVVHFACCSFAQQINTNNAHIVKSPLCYWRNEKTQTQMDATVWSKQCTYICRKCSGFRGRLSTSSISNDFFSSLRFEHFTLNLKLGKQLK